ncbi:unnamed protein product [Cuscuta europaea]|uniref:DUF7787 domain-containing protein n=1 Tax=Cuscuta europaea TaxID=41803 RepID=A0A9P1E4L1_CUSEU|nr:unnamed protein product [Cuscuta europaea]
MAESGIVERGRRSLASSSRARGKLTVEEYLNFIDTNRQLHLTAPHLREIIDMHGFKAMRSASKNSVLEAVGSMELIELGRSTLQHDREREMRGKGVWNHHAAAAAADIKTVKQDLAALKWEECCVTSLHTTTFLNSHQIQSGAAPHPLLLPNSNKKQRVAVKPVTVSGKKRKRCLNNIPLST